MPKWLRRTGFKRRARGSLPSTAYKKRRVFRKSRGGFRKGRYSKYMKMGATAKKIFNSKIAQAGEALMWTSAPIDFPQLAQITIKALGTEAVYPVCTLYDCLDRFHTAMTAEGAPDHNGSVYVKSITLRLLISQNLVANCWANCEMGVWKVTMRQRGYTPSQLELNRVLGSASCTANATAYARVLPNILNYENAKEFIGKMGFKKYKMGRSLTTILFRETVVIKWKIKVMKKCIITTSDQLKQQFRDRGIYVAGLLSSAIGTQAVYGVQVPSYQIVYSETS